MLSSERKHILAPTRSCRGCTSNVISLQSTSLIRGKTRWSGICRPSVPLFNPLPSSEGRRLRRSWRKSPEFFNPLPSSEGRPFRLLRSSIRSFFNPLPSSEGRHHAGSLQTEDLSSSIHFPHPREDGRADKNAFSFLLFNPLPSSEGRLISVI